MSKKNLSILDKLSPEERKELLNTLQQEDAEQKLELRNTYEKLRHNFAVDVMGKVTSLTVKVKDFKDWLDGESECFRELMAEYGQLRNGEQQSYTILDGDFKLEVKSNKVKQFDERADIAAQKLMDYLDNYIKNSDKGSDDPIYQLAMSLLERNRQGQLDYKSISKLYELEGKFDSEYKQIMDLFRESNVVMATAINYYFSICDEHHVWHRIEPSFCRL